MSHFSRSTEDVLRRARLTEAMPLEKRHRLKASILSRLAGASVMAAAGQAAGAGFGSSTTWFVVKGVAVVAIAASAGTVGVRASRAPAERVHPVLAGVDEPSRDPAPAPRPLETLAPRSVPSSSREGPVAPRSAPLAPSPRSERAQSFAVMTPSSTGSPRSAPATVTARPLPADTAALADEARALREADRALRVGMPGIALEQLDAHERRFPEGALGPERAALRVVALCQRGELDARGAAYFVASHPRAPLAARIKQACGAR